MRPGRDAHEQRQAQTHFRDWSNLETRSFGFVSTAIAYLNVGESAHGSHEVVGHQAEDRELEQKQGRIDRNGLRRDGPQVYDHVNAIRQRRCDQHQDHAKSFPGSLEERTLRKKTKEKRGETAAQ